MMWVIYHVREAVPMGCSPSMGQEKGWEVPPHQEMMHMQCRMWEVAMATLPPGLVYPNHENRGCACARA